MPQKLLDMQWETADHIVSILVGVVVLLGGGSLVVWWQRITNKKKADRWKEKHDLVAIENKALRAKLETFKTVEDTILAFREAAKSNPEVAKALLPYLTDLIK